MGASVIAGGIAPPVLELGEEIFDLVALAVERLVVGIGNFAAAARRNAGLYATGFLLLSEPCAVMAAIGDEMRGRRQGAEHETGHPCDRSSGLQTGAE
ncbi:hypothetical protein NA8A_12330 [Nitratireductor indicus C115]|uniref:Uncharacterized protein n=1 Tax=Nitratireductor indicus C115 TaxID=1231190 RepID=K2PMM7_9HYPH|nr:hypothetical protein NA8A_12330 [Nitratireductor indicus C115]